MSKICAICGRPVESGVVVHLECVQRWIPASDVDEIPWEGPENNQIKCSDTVYATDGVSRYVGCFRKWKYDGDIEFVGVDVEDIAYGGGRVTGVTHWMPLPQPPKELLKKGAQE